MTGSRVPQVPFAQRGNRDMMRMQSFRSRPLQSGAQRVRPSPETLQGFNGLKSYNQPAFELPGFKYSPKDEPGVFGRTGPGGYSPSMTRRSQPSVPDVPEAAPAAKSRMPVKSMLTGLVAGGAYTTADILADPALKAHLWMKSPEEKAKWYAAQANPDAERGWMESAFNHFVDDDTRRQITEEATPFMMNEGFSELLGTEKDGNMKQSLMSTLGPMGIAALLGLYGMNSGNYAMLLPALLAGGYGWNNLQNSQATLKDPKLLAMAAGHTGSLKEQQTAKKQLRQAYQKAKPLWNMKNQFTGGGQQKTAGMHTNSIMSHFHLQKMIDEVRSDPNISAMAAGKFIGAARNAQRFDAKPSGLISVGGFAQSVANGIGSHLGQQIGSLMTLPNRTKNRIKGIAGGGLFSGARALGVI